MCSNDDPFHLPLAEHVTHSNHRYGNIKLRPSRCGERGVSLCHLLKCAEQSLEQLPTSKLLNDQQVLDQTPIRQVLQGATNTSNACYTLRHLSILSKFAFHFIEGSQRNSKRTNLPTKDKPKVLVYTHYKNHF